MAETSYSYDAFISYSHWDQDWVMGQLLPRLEAAGIDFTIDVRDFRVGVPARINMERAIDQSKYVIIVLTPRWIAFEWTQMESLLFASKDGERIRRKLLPIILKECELPPRIGVLTYADFRDYSKHDESFQRLIKAILDNGNHHNLRNNELPSENKALVFISAKSSDYNHAKIVYEFLCRSGMRCFFSDESLPQVGSSDYGREIDRALEEAEHLIVVTSSKENADSGWVRHEWNSFLIEKRAERKSGNLVTVTVGSLEPASLPWSLRSYEVVPIENLERVLRYVRTGAEVR